MDDPVEQTRLLAETNGLKFRDNGDGHVQLENHGVLVNYWPLSKRRTVHIKGGETIQHCGPWDAVKACLGVARDDMKPKAPSKNGPDFDLKPIRTNPAGIKNFYTGTIPPWDERFGEFIICHSDALRIQAKALLDEAEAMETEQC